MKTRHGYVCECCARRCKQRLYLSPTLYEDIRRMGSVLSASCVRREDRIVLRDYRTFAVCLTSNGGRPITQ